MKKDALEILFYFLILSFVFIIGFSIGAYSTHNYYQELFKSPPTPMYNFSPVIHEDIYTDIYDNEYQNEHQTVQLCVNDQEQINIMRGVASNIEGVAVVVNNKSRKCTTDSKHITIYIWNYYEEYPDLSYFWDRVEECENPNILLPVSYCYETGK